MRLARTAAALALAASSLWASPATGQLAWDSPRMVGPETPSGLGVYWLRSEVLPGDGDAIFGTWGLPGAGRSVTVRGGFGKGVAGENAVFGGIELRAPIARHSDTQPLDFEWSGGAGVGVGEYILVTAPLSVSAGRSWASGSVWFAPYLSLGAALEYRYGDSDAVPDEEFEVQATAGLGADLAFDPARRFVLRVATSLGDRQSIAVGLMVSGGP